MAPGVRGWWGWLLALALVYGLAEAGKHRRQSGWWQSPQHSMSGHPRWGSREVAGLGILRGESRFDWGANSLFPREMPAVPSRRSPISIQCSEDTIRVNVSRDFYGNGFMVKPGDLSLGSENCKPFSQNPDSVVFKSKLQDCGSTLKVTPDHLIYRSVLNYRPTPDGGILRSSPAAVPIQCLYSRHRNVSSDAIVPTWTPFSTTASSEAKLSFSLHLMTSEWMSLRPTTVFHLGEMLYIEASVDTENHAPLLLYVDSCVATTSADPGSSPRYEIIFANGCLVDGRQEDATSSFRSPRVQQDKLQFAVDVFRFLGVDLSVIYITCNLKAVEADHIPDSTNKACSYSKDTSSWSPVEGSPNICQCCNTGTCSSFGSQSRFWNPERYRRIGKRDVGHQAERGQATLGPILVIGADAQPVPEARAHQATLISQESNPAELWILVAVASVSMVVVAVGGVLIGKHLWKRFSHETTEK